MKSFRLLVTAFTFGILGCANVLAQPIRMVSETVAEEIQEPSDFYAVHFLKEDGNLHTFNFSEGFSMAFEGEYIRISSSLYSALLPYSEYYGMEFDVNFHSSAMPDPGASVTHPGATPTFTFKGSEIHLCGDVNKIVSIHNLDGQTFFTERVLTDKVIDISALPEGIYILNAGDYSFKFVRK